MTEVIAYEVSQAGVWATVASIVLVGVALVIAAVLDRRRAMDIVADRSRLSVGRAAGRHRAAR
jgi:hypothetical protein